MAVVKANAYEHGVIKISKLAIKNGAQYLGVATIEEGIEIRKSGITIPVLILGAIFPEQSQICSQYNLNISISSISLFERLCSLIDDSVVLNIHLNIDTGMHQIGIDPDEIKSFLSFFHKNKGRVRLNGIWTHFPIADSLDRTYTLKQVEKFTNAVHLIKSTKNNKLIVHSANSAAAINLPESYFDMVRIGLGIYGYYDNLNFFNKISLQPALRWITKVVCIKKVKKDEGIGYGQTFVTKRNSIIATIPVGYADGYSRLLSNKGWVLVNGYKAPIVGRVCMDQTMIDITDIPDVHEGIEVVLIGNQENNSISIYDLCSLLKTIPNDILVNISQRVYRRYQY